MLRRASTSKAILIISAFTVVASMACSLVTLGSRSSDQEAAAQESPTLLAETPTPLPSPTETLAPTPTETPLPTLAPTPSYDWCKGMNTRVAKEDEVKIGPEKGDKAFATYACLLEASGPIREYPQPAIRLKIGFNDKNGVLHIYTAIAGALIYKSNPVAEFTYPACYKKDTEDPTMLAAADYLQALNAYMAPGAPPKEFPLLVHLELGYDNHWPSEASLVNRYTDLNNSLKAAIEAGEGFPEVPERYRMYVLPGLEDCP